MAFKNTKTSRHSEIKQTRPSTKQHFLGEVLPKQSTEASLASLSYSSQAPTEWSAIFAFGVWMHLGSLENTQKLDLFSAIASSNFYAILCSPNFLHASITRYTHAKHESILKFRKVTGVKIWRLSMVGYKSYFLQWSNKHFRSMLPFSSLIKPL